ncbi:MAG: glucose-6-phosphate isomerase [Bacilli bacterium]
MIKFDFETYIDNKNQKLKEIESINPEDIPVYKDNMGWYDLDNLFRKELVADINNTASYIRENCDVFLVIGTGGSYLGAKGVIEALNPYFYNEIKKPEIQFVGTSLSSDYYHDLIEKIKDKELIVNVISKSGGTLETTIFYHLIMKMMRDKYSSEELKKRVIITTDNDSGFLLKEAKDNNFKTFIIPDNIGGRFSVFTPAGLLPIAVSSININGLYKGAKAAKEAIKEQFEYANTRIKMIEQNKIVEAFVCYEPKLKYFLEWLKQLYAESLGKENKGLLPISIINTGDLHSLGQFIQEGNKILFETVIVINKVNNDYCVDEYNRNLSDINNIAMISTAKSHLIGNVSSNIITIDKLNEESVGYLIQFFMTSCLISGYLEKVNPFNQDGVEKYKEIMRDLLGK